MTNWPSDLPQQFAGDGSYSETTPNLVVRTSMEVGPPRVRARFTRNYYECSGTMLMTRAQVNSFKAWYANTIRGGQFQGALDGDPVLKTYQFKEDPTFQHVGSDYYRMSASLIIVPT